MRNPWTKQEFIDACCRVHGDRFDYGLVLYVNATTKVKIKCLKCGNSFSQRPSAHLSGQGCPSCRNKNLANSKKIIRESHSAGIVSRFQGIHGDKYDYSRVSYQEAGKRVEIGCKRCGRWFWVFPNNHLRGKGCKICAQQDRGKRESEEYSTDVIGRFRIVHGEKYDYSNVVCKNAIQEVEIRCLTCNSVFLQRPSCHLRGDGCKKCADRMNGENRKNAEKEEVLGKFYKVHGDRYDYSNVAYDGDDVKVSIKCKKCNHMFLQTPSHHKLGNGCPRCNESSGEILVSKILESSDIKFERQKAISGCCYRRRLLFDFYFSMNGHEFAIEYNGIQHYRPVSIFGGEAGFLQTTCRDEIKRRFCKEKGIRLIEIPYTENSLGKISKTLREQVGITGESLT